MTAGRTSPPGSPRRSNELKLNSPRQRDCEPTSGHFEGPASFGRSPDIAGKIRDAAAKVAFSLTAAPFLTAFRAGGRHVVPFLVVGLTALAGTIRLLTLVFLLIHKDSSM